MKGVVRKEEGHGDKSGKGQLLAAAPTGEAIVQGRDWERIPAFRF